MSLIHKARTLHYASLTFQKSTQDVVWSITVVPNAGSTNRAHTSPLAGDLANQSLHRLLLPITDPQYLQLFLLHFSSSLHRKLNTRRSLSGEFVFSHILSSINLYKIMLVRPCNIHSQPQF